MKRHYTAVIEQDENPGYSVFFPDLPGCTSAGDTISEAIEMAKEAASLYVDVLQEDGSSLPEATDPDEIAKNIDDDVDVAVMALVEVTSHGKKQRYNLTLDSELVKQVDSLANNRSAFFEEAARVAIHNRVFATSIGNDFTFSLAMLRQKMAELSSALDTSIPEVSIQTDFVGGSHSKNEISKLIQKELVKLDEQRSRIPGTIIR